MKRICTVIILTLLLSASSALADSQIPKSVAGITLGSPMAEYTSLCDEHRGGPLPDAAFLSEVHIKANGIPGIRGGSIAYANATPGKKVVRVKLKFHDRDQGLFKELHKKYSAKFGNPANYRGDPFRNVIAWQWDFAKGEEKVSLLLMWSRDRQMRPGVSIKMTYESLVDEEYNAFKERHGDGEVTAPTEIENLEDFIPR